MAGIQTTSPRRWWPWIVGIGCGVLACVMLVVLAMLAVGGGLAFLGLREWAQSQNWNPDDEPWTETAIPLPDDWGQVIFLRQSAHPVMAEYNRKLRLELTGQTPHVVEMPMNVGGRTFINVYWVAEGVDGHATLQLIDHWGMYVVDMEAPPATARWVTRYEGKWRLNGASEETPALLETLADHEYLGCLDGQEWPLRFVPASEAPETEIDFVGSGENHGWEKCTMCRSFIGYFLHPWLSPSHVLISSYASASNSIFAPWRSSVSKPSVNQP